MTLSLKLRLRRDSSPNRAISDSSFARTEMPLQTRIPGGPTVGGYAPDFPRRVTRALARKLQEGSFDSAEVREISPVLAATSPEVKEEEVDLSETSSLSPPCLTVSIQPTVKEEHSVRIRDFPPEHDDSDRVSPSTPPRLGLVVCSTCGNSDVRMTNRECSNTSSGKDASWRSRIETKRKM
jgi:hypothetical protein